MSPESRRPSVDIMDQTYVVADRTTLSVVLADPSLWRRWWPRLELTVVRDRGPLGTQWSVQGELAGTAEIWLETWHDGVIVHWFLRGEPAAHAARGRWRRRRPDPASIRDHYVASFKRRIHALKDEMEAGRMPGDPRPSRRRPGNRRSRSSSASRPARSPIR